MNLPNAKFHKVENIFASQENWKFCTQILLYYQRGGPNPKGCPSVGAKGHVNRPFALQIWFVITFLHFLFACYQATTLLDIILLNSFVHPHL
jgi:hypothetical protein